MKKGFLDGYKKYDTSNGFGNTEKWRKSFYQRMTREEAQAVLQQTTETPYSILGVAQDAPPEQIKKAFRKKIWEWHPDKNPHRLQEAEEMSKKINAAYSILMS